MSQPPSRGRPFKLERLSNLGYLWFLGLVGFLHPIYPPLQLFHLFFLFGLFWLFGLLLDGLRFLVRYLTNRRASRREGGDAQARNDQYRDEARALARFSWLGFLGTTLNPFGLIQSFAQLGGQLVAYLRYLGKGFRLPAPKTYRQRTVFTLPFEGTWTVVNGGTDEATSHSWALLAQRYAYDFVVMDATGKTYRDDGRRLEDYYAFGQPILAPAAGRVVRVREGVRDYAYLRPGSGSIDWRTRDFRGNFVVIEHTRGEYSFLTHLQQGSICVHLGDTVRRGQKIGSCGNSGHSTEPHLHFHVQDHPDVFIAVSLPVRFASFRLMDEPALEVCSDAYLTRGQRVAPVTPNHR